MFGFLGSALEADRRSGLQCLLNELVDQVGLRIYENWKVYKFSGCAVQVLQGYALSMYMCCMNLYVIHTFLYCKKKWKDIIIHNLFWQRIDKVIRCIQKYSVCGKMAQNNNHLVNVGNKKVSPVKKRRRKIIETKAHFLYENFIVYFTFMNYYIRKNCFNIKYQAS